MKWRAVTKRVQLRAAFVVQQGLVRKSPRDQKAASRLQFGGEGLRLLQQYQDRRRSTKMIEVGQDQRLDYSKSEEGLAVRLLRLDRQLHSRLLLQEQEHQVMPPKWLSLFPEGSGMPGHGLRQWPCRSAAHGWRRMAADVHCRHRLLLVFVVGQDKEGKWP